jgi:hypothetical protein
MKQIIAYISEKGNTNTVYRKKSEALSADFQIAAATIAKKCVGENNQDKQYICAKSLGDLANKGVSPRRLMRMYSKLWRIRQAQLTALEEECQQEEIPF